MRADFRLAVAEHARALGLETIARRDDVVDLVTDVMHAAVGIALEEFRDRRIRAERLEQFDLGIGQHDENGGDAMLGLRHRLGHLGAERLAIGARRLFDVAHRDGDVIEPSDHLDSLRCYTVSTCT